LRRIINPQNEPYLQPGYFNSLKAAAISRISCCCHVVYPAGVEHSGTKHLLRRTYIKEGYWLVIKKNAYENNAVICNEKMILLKKTLLSELVIFFHLLISKSFLSGKLLLPVSRIK
jgi:hypothetical protein